MDLAKVMIIIPKGGPTKTTFHNYILWFCIPLPPPTQPAGSKLCSSVGALCYTATCQGAVYYFTLSLHEPCTLKVCTAL